MGKNHQPGLLIITNRATLKTSISKIRTKKAAHISMKIIKKMKPWKKWLKEQKKNRLQKKLVGFIVDDRRVPRHGYKVHDMEDNEIGIVTSGTQSPTLNYPIGLAYVPSAFAKEGTKIQINMDTKCVNAHVCKLPFLEN